METATRDTIASSQEASAEHKTANMAAAYWRDKLKFTHVWLEVSNREKVKASCIEIFCLFRRTSACFVQSVFFSVEHNATILPKGSCCNSETE